MSISSSAGISRATPVTYSAITPPLFGAPTNEVVTPNPGPTVGQVESDISRTSEPPLFPRTPGSRAGIIHSRAALPPPGVSSEGGTVGSDVPLGPPYAPSGTGFYGVGLTKEGGVAGQVGFNHTIPDAPPAEGISLELVEPGVNANSLGQNGLTQNVAGELLA